MVLSILNFMFLDSILHIKIFWMKALFALPLGRTPPLPTDQEAGWA